MVGEAVAHVAQTTLLDVLLDGVERLFLGDFHLGIGPAGNLDDHVENAIVPICKERDVVERGDDLTALLDVDAMFCYYIDWILEAKRSHVWLKVDIPRVLGAPMSRGVYSGKASEIGGRAEGDGTEHTGHCGRREEANLMRDSTGGTPCRHG